MITLTKEQVLMLHNQLIEATGGSKGIRNLSSYRPEKFVTVFLCLKTRRER